MTFIRTTFITALFSLSSLTAHSKDHLDIVLDWFINPDHAALVIADNEGFFAAHDLDVSLIEPSDPSLPPKLVAAGKADLAITYQPQLHVQVDQGLPLSRISTLVATPLNTLLVLKDSDNQSIADLKGKKIGYSVSGFEDALLSAMLANAGLSLDDIETVNVNWSLAPSLISGQVDAVIGAYRNFELNAMDIEGHPGRAFYVEEHGVPPYDELIVVAHNEQRSRDAYRRFNAAIEEATQFIINHPDDAWHSFIAHKPELNDELNRRAWRDTLPRLALRPAAYDAQRYQRFAEFMQDHGLLSHAIAPLDTYVITP